MDAILPNTAFFRTLVLLSANRIEEAVAEAERGATLCGRLPLMTGLLGLAYGSAGYHDRARLVLSEYRPRARYVPPMPVALTYVD